MNIAKITAKAWEIRKNIAKELSCKPSEVLWSVCLEMADESNGVDVAEVTVHAGELAITLTYGVSTREVRLDGQLVGQNTSIIEDVKLYHPKAGDIWTMGQNEPHQITGKEVERMPWVAKDYKKGVRYTWGHGKFGEDTGKLLFPALEEAHKKAVTMLSDKAIVSIAMIEEEEAEKEARAKKNIEEEIKERANRGIGWCNKCQSYCYGDCEA